VVVGNPEGKRVTHFQAALQRLGLAPATVLSYHDFLTGRDSLQRHVREGALVRIESPGQDFEVEKALLAAGADAPDEEEAAPRLSRHDVARLVLDRGRILHPRQWYLGFRDTLRRLGRQLASSPRHRLMNRPDDIERMFDKCRCHALCEAGSIPVPRGLGRVRSFEELRLRMDKAGCRRVFVKLAHGSSASGVVAYETNGRRHQAFTSVEVVRAGGELRLYNSRRIRRCREPAEIAEVIDALGPERVQVEAWFPKAAFEDGSFDLRVVVIDGQAWHTVVRLSRTPMTNLHLKNQRGDLAGLRDRLGDEVWQAVRHTCVRAAGLFPSSLYAGVDVALAAGYRRHTVLEVNAFGDLLPGVVYEGSDTYTAEVEAALQAQAVPA
jgi:hypothetical protein